MAQRLLELIGRKRPSLAPSSESSDPWNDDFPAALASIAFMLMLGFVDDVLDLPWRVKLVMPIVASMPLLAAYSGATAIGIPKPIVEAFSLAQTYVELGPFYYVYMVMLVIFCTNSINILAGVNGLEAGQTFVVSVAMLTHNLLQLARNTGAPASGINYHPRAAPSATGSIALCVWQHFARMLDLDRLHAGAVVMCC